MAHRLLVLLLLLTSACDVDGSFYDVDVDDDVRDDVRDGDTSDAAHGR